MRITRNVVVYITVALLGYFLHSSHARALEMSTPTSFEVSSFSLESVGVSEAQMNQLIGEVWNIKIEMIRLADEINKSQDVAIETQSNQFETLISVLGVLSGVLLVLVWAVSIKM